MPYIKGKSGKGQKLPCADVDAATYKKWGVDYVKVDDCNSTYTGDVDQEHLYTAWADAVNRSGHPLLIDTCEWGAEQPWAGWGKGTMMLLAPALFIFIMPGSSLMYLMNALSSLDAARSYPK